MNPNWWAKQITLSCLYWVNIEALIPLAELNIPFSGTKRLTLDLCGHSDQRLSWNSKSIPSLRRCKRDRGIPEARARSRWQRQSEMWKRLGPYSSIHTTNLYCAPVIDLRLSFFPTLFHSFSLSYSLPSSLAFFMSVSRSPFLLSLFLPILYKTDKEVTGPASRQEEIPDKGPWKWLPYHHSRHLAELPFQLICDLTLMVTI